MNLRRGVRALVIDDEGQIVLVRFDHPDRTVWATPGGGVEEGESDEAALERELREELGLAVTELGAHVWERTHVFPMTQWEGQAERYYLVRVPRLEIHPELGWDALRSEGIGEIRWWSVDEIEASTGAIFAPARLGRFLRELLRDGPPPTPIDVGV